MIENNVLTGSKVGKRRFDISAALGTSADSIATSFCQIVKSEAEITPDELEYGINYFQIEEKHVNFKKMDADKVIEMCCHFEARPNPLQKKINSYLRSK